MGLVDLINRRRTTRHFEPDGLFLPRETIEEMIIQASAIPSEFGVKPWRFIIVRDRERKQVLYECAYGQDQIRQAAAVIIVCGDTRVDALVGKNLEKKVDEGLITAEEAKTRLEIVRKTIESSPRARLQMAVRTPSFAAFALMLLATERGLATASVSGFSEEAIRRAFHMSDRFIPVQLVAIGIPSMQHPNASNTSTESTSQFIFHEDMGLTDI